MACCCCCSCSCRCFRWCDCCCWCCWFLLVVSRKLDSENKHTDTHKMFAVVVVVLGGGGGQCLFIYADWGVSHVLQDIKKEREREREKGGYPRKRRETKNNNMISQIATLNRDRVILVLFQIYNNYSSQIFNQSIKVQHSRRGRKSPMVDLFLVEQQTKSARKFGMFEQQFL